MRQRSSIGFLKQYHLPITFLRQKKEERRLVICLGAGFCSPLGLPGWEKLVESISEHEKIQGKAIFECKALSLTSKIQVLAEIYKKKYLEELRGQNESQNFNDDIIRIGWIKIMRNCIYDRAQGYKNGLLSNHPYLAEYTKIIKETPVVVNYNFDDVIEKTLRNDSNLKVETTTRLSMPYNLQKTIIYHPNGYIPNSSENGVEGDFVFSEKSFQDQLIDTISGRYSPLQYLFLSHTMLLTGLSLDDPTLRHMLRKNATLNPGHFHFYIYYTGDDKNLSEEDKDAIKESYFETFNLITLFLNDDGIKKLAKYIALDKEHFDREIIQSHLFRSFKYYISGSPGSGKTSSIHQLTDFVIQDEFPEPTRDDLYQQDENLENDQRMDLDDWITEQFRIRNSNISDVATDSCIQLIDRTPIDPLCFVDATKDDAFVIRANELKANYQDCNPVLQKGNVIVLKASKEEVFNRLNKRNPNMEGKDYNYSMAFVEKTIGNFEKLFPSSKIYQYIDTTKLNQSLVAKKIVHEIFFEEYHEIDFLKILDGIIKKHEDE